MKRCLSCNKTFEAAGWICPACGAEPVRQNGFLAFAPELSDAQAGFFPQEHETLDRLQAGSFWFRYRNSLLGFFISTFCPEARKVLEIGCGTGYVLANIGKILPSASLIGSELDTAGLGFAAGRLGPKATLLQMDARHIPFEAEFDLVAACDVLEHIDEDQKVISELARALKPGGYALLTVPQHPFLWSSSDDHACHKRRYKRGELAAKVRAEGFEIVRDTSFITILMPLMLLQRLKDRKKATYNPADELALPPALDRILEYLLSIEGFAIKHGVSLPFGGSRLILARKASIAA